MSCAERDHIILAFALAANEGSVIEIEVSGPDAEQAMRELEEFLMHEPENNPTSDPDQRKG